VTTLGIVVLAALALIAVAALAALFFERRAGIERRKAAEAERDLAQEQVAEEREAHTVAVSWLAGESGDDVVLRARTALAAAGAPTPAA